MADVILRGIIKVNGRRLNGSVTITPTGPAISGGELTLPDPVTIPIVDGTFPSTFPPLTITDSMSFDPPVPYRVEFFDDNGNRLALLHYYITGYAGAPPAPSDPNVFDFGLTKPMSGPNLVATTGNDASGIRNLAALFASFGELSVTGHASFEGGISFSAIDGVEIGDSDPRDGAFLNLAATGVFTLNGQSMHGWADAEIPTGTINGANAVFTLAHTPVGGSLQLFLNGVKLRSGVAFALAGNQITYVGAYIPQEGDIHEAYYRY